MAVRIDRNWMHGRRGVIAVLLCLVAFLPARAQITTNTALQIAEGQGVLRIQTRLMRGTGDSSTQNRELTVVAVPVVGVYGINARLTLFGVLPFLSKEMGLSTPQGRVSRRTTGLGDARFFVRYTALATNRRGEMIRLAPLAGVALPTGNDNDTDALGWLPQPMQLGSGSWGPFFGLVFTRHTLDWHLDVAPTYTIHTEANDFRFGDEARLDVSTTYRLFPRDLRRGAPGFLFAVLENNLIWQDQNQASGNEMADSGGVTWYVVPGLQYVTVRFTFEAGVQIPLLQDLGGDALKNDFIAILSARMNI